MQISSVLGRLPVVLAGDVGTIPHKYRAGLRSGTHCFDHDLARADSAPRGEGCPVYFVNSWALGLGFRRYVNKDVVIKPAANHYHSNHNAILICAQ